MKAYLMAMLSNKQTLYWEKWLPALMFSYNTQVHFDATPRTANRKFLKK